MGTILVILLLLAGIAIFFYYLVLIISGKRLARFVDSKDRFIWNGLHNISQDAGHLKGRNTVFLDAENVVISNHGVLKILSELKQTGGLESALAIPYQNIVSFDYDSKSANVNIILRFFSAVWNRLLKKNDFILSLSYLDEKKLTHDLFFKASGLDINDFEATFADFNNKISGGRHSALAESQYPNRPKEVLTPSPQAEVSRENQLFFVNEAKLEPHSIEVPEEQTMSIKKPILVEDLPIVEEEVPFQDKHPTRPRSLGVNDLTEKPSDPTVRIAPLKEPQVEDKTMMISKKEFLEGFSKRPEVVFERPKGYKEKE